ncbi:glycosyltransferase [Microcoleus sp. FACHB-SPT15]|uniref:glycosyltransferase family 2 protein n=1 Tax=Microcoleus sp. FACHB-SPT15 TaxID=2692830 RepID=UPI00177F8667|nr:glycosyltransferase [Microcoleus sp. FACHB-SPT15]MBD1809592.1 glycosyltransferase [Microcoleus sp. FACHB-SPT15]
MPTISVVIPAYNAERTILETIASVQQQTFSDFELIVINDGSTDRTLELLYNVQDERLKIFSYENGGLPVARNRGISQANGEFIAFIDADDLWTPDKLELQLAALQQHPEAGVAYSWTYFKYEEKEYSYADESSFFEGNVYANLLVRNFLHNGSNPLIRKQAIESIGLFDANLKSCEDWDFYLRLAAKWNFVLIPKSQIIYRQSLSSMTSKVEVMEKYLLIVIGRAFQVAPTELQFLKKQSLSWVYKYAAQQYLKYGGYQYKNLILATVKLAKAILIQPKILLEEYTQGLIRRLVKSWIILPFNSHAISQM